MRTTARCGALILAAALFAGCAATPSVRQDGLGVDASRHRQAHVRVEGDDRVRNLHGYDLTRAALAKAFVEQLRASGKFTVLDAPAPAAQGLDVELRITNLNYASGAERGLTGSLGSRAVLSVTMTVSDLESKESLGRVTAGHASSRGQGVFSPTTSRQADAIGKELAERLANAAR
jgi:hypothetical protein